MIRLKIFLYTSWEILPSKKVRKIRSPMALTFELKIIQNKRGSWQFHLSQLNSMVPTQAHLQQHGHNLECNCDKKKLYSCESLYSLICYSHFFFISWITFTLHWMTRNQIPHTSVLLPMSLLLHKHGLSLPKCTSPMRILHMVYHKPLMVIFIFRFTFS